MDRWMVLWMGGGCDRGRHPPSLQRPPDLAPIFPLRRNLLRLPSPRNLPPAVGAAHTAQPPHSPRTAHTHTHTQTHTHTHTHARARTPLPPQLWALLNFLLPEVFSSAEKFEEWFGMGDGSKEKEAEVVQQLHKVGAGMCVWVWVCECVVWG